MPTHTLQIPGLRKNRLYPRSHPDRAEWGSVAKRKNGPEQGFGERLALLRKEAGYTQHALASVAGADTVVSRNFKHLVQLRRIRGFHAVNVPHGYPLIEIRSAREVIDDED